MTQLFNSPDLFLSGKKEVPMPTIYINMFEGRTIDQKRKMVAAMTDALVNSLDVKPETVHIIISESPKHHIAVGGVLVSDKKV
jgi:4-oxalocrotonate tautomerase